MTIFKKKPEMKIELISDAEPDASGNPGYILSLQLGPWADDAVPESGREIVWGLETPMKLEQMEGSRDVTILDPIIIDSATVVPLWLARFEVVALKEADSQIVQIKVYRLSADLRRPILYEVYDKATGEELHLGNWLFDFPS